MVTAVFAGGPGVRGAEHWHRCATCDQLVGHPAAESCGDAGWRHAGVCPEGVFERAYLEVSEDGQGNVRG